MILDDVKKLPENGEKPKNDEVSTLLTQATFTLDLYQPYLSYDIKQDPNEAAILKLQSLGTDIVTDLILPLSFQVDYKNIIPSFIKTIEVTLDKYTNEETDVFVRLAMLRKLLRSFDSNPFKLDNRYSVCPMWQFSIEVYKELDKRKYPAVFKVLELNDKDKVEEARKALHKFTSLFFLETKRPMEEVPLDALKK